MISRLPVLSISLPVSAQTGTPFGNFNKTRSLSFATKIQGKKANQAETNTKAKAKIKNKKAHWWQWRSIKKHPFRTFLVLLFMTPILLVSTGILALSLFVRSQFSKSWNEAMKPFDISKFQSPERRKAYLKAEKEFGKFLDRLGDRWKTSTIDELVDFMKKDWKGFEVYRAPRKLIKEYTGSKEVGAFFQPKSPEEAQEHEKRLLNALTGEERKKYKDYINLLEKQEKIAKERGWDTNKPFIVIPSEEDKSELFSKLFSKHPFALFHEKAHQIQHEICGIKEFDVKRFSTFKDFYDYHKIRRDNDGYFEKLDKSKFSQAVIDAVRDNDLIEVETYNILMKNRHRFNRKFKLFFTTRNMREKAFADSMMNLNQLEYGISSYRRLLGISSKNENPLPRNLFSGNWLRKFLEDMSYSANLKKKMEKKFEETRQRIDFGRDKTGLQTAV